MKTFKARGTYTQKKEKHHFAKEISAENEKLAREKIYAEFGGKQRITRRNINIEEIKEAKH